MKEKFVLSHIVLISSLSAVSIFSINSILIWQALFLCFYLAASAFTANAILNQRRRSQSYCRYFVFLSSLLSFVALALNLNSNSYILFLMSHITLISMIFVTYDYLKLCKFKRHNLCIEGVFPKFDKSIFQILNMSTTGCLLKTDEKLEIGTEYSLQICLSDTTVNLRALVVRQGEENQYGLVFKGLDQRSFKNIAEIYSSLVNNSNEKQFSLAS